MSVWLQAHIFTGLVGPYMVLLHTSWKFNGLAGIVMLLTLIIVISGFIGRYIYTAVPRSLDGTMIDRPELDQQISLVQAELERMVLGQPGIAPLVGSPQLTAVRSPKLMARFLDGWQFNQEWRQLQGQLPAESRPLSTRLESLLKQRRNLSRQVASLASARRMLSLWHAIHIPIGAALFTAAFIHAGAAIYYATLLH
jgi:hypothetical protein